MAAGALLFDFGGTLDADGIPWGRRFHAAYRAAGGGLSFAEFEPIFQASDRALETEPDIHRLGFREMVARQAALLCANLPDGGCMDADRIARDFHVASTATVARNREVITRLARRFRLGIVSNFTGNLERCLDELGLLAFFDVVSDSSVVGAAKPAPRIFEVTLEALGVKPGAAWMIGDNFEADVRAAARLGLSTCWLAPAERPLPAEGVATARTASFTNLESILG